MKTQLYAHLLKSTNLYSVTNPILDVSSKEAEIEHLFSDEVLETKIDGNPLSLSGDYDKSKYYGKVTFSKYIMDNYKTIDFTNFKTILDNISKIVQEYRDTGWFNWKISNILTTNKEDAGWTSPVKTDNDKKGPPMVE